MQINCIAISWPRQKTSPLIIFKLLCRNCIRFKIPSTMVVEIIFEVLVHCCSSVFFLNHGKRRIKFYPKNISNANQMIIEHVFFIFIVETWHYFHGVFVPTRFRVSEVLLIILFLVSPCWWKLSSMLYLPRLNRSVSDLILVSSNIVYVRQDTSALNSFQKLSSNVTWMQMRINTMCVCERERAKRRKREPIKWSYFAAEKHTLF